MSSGISRFVEVVCPHCGHCNSVLTWSSSSGAPQLVVCGDGNEEGNGCSKYFVVKAVYSVTVDTTVGLLDYSAAECATQG